MSIFVPSVRHKRKAHYKFAMRPSLGQCLKPENGRMELICKKRRQTRRNDGKHGEATANREKRLRLRMRTRKDKWGEKGGDKEKQGKREETRQNRDNVAI